MRRALAAAILVVVACGPNGVPERSFTSGSSASPSAAATTAGQPTWKRVADITTPRSEVAAAVFRGVVYLVGGFGGGNVAETYVADRWSAAARYPISVDHAMAAGVDTPGTPGRRPSLRKIFSFMEACHSMIFLAHPYLIQRRPMDAYK